MNKITEKMIFKPAFEYIDNGMMISSKDEIGSVMPGTPGCIPNNKGIHILHTGGRYASYLQMPLMK